MNRNGLFSFVIEDGVLKRPAAWTTDTPTEPGWYWWKPSDGHARIFELLRSPTGDAYLPTWARRKDCAWSGPLQPPTSP